MSFFKITIPLMLVMLRCSSTTGNIEKYTGQKPRCLRGDCYDGFGIQQTDEIEIYSGYFSKGKYHGQGEFRCADAGLVKGNFTDGKISGKFEMHFFDLKIKGNIKAGLYDGVIQTTSTKLNGLDTFEITYENGILHGRTYMSYKSGEGSMTLNFKHGEFIDGSYSGKRGVSPLTYTKIIEYGETRCILDTVPKMPEKASSSVCLDKPFPPLYRGCNGI